jgi:hypothetical protein
MAPPPPPWPPRRRWRPPRGWWGGDTGHTGKQMSQSEGREHCGVMISVHPSSLPQFSQPGNLPMLHFMRLIFSHGCTKFVSSPQESLSVTREIYFHVQFLFPPQIASPNANTTFVFCDRTGLNKTHLNKNWGQLIWRGGTSQQTTVRKQRHSITFSAYEFEKK